MAGIGLCIRHSSGRPGVWRFHFALRQEGHAHLCFTSEQRYSLTPLPPRVSETRHSPPGSPRRRAAQLAATEHLASLDIYSLFRSPRHIPVTCLRVGSPGSDVTRSRAPDSGKFNQASSRLNQ